MNAEPLGQRAETIFARALAKTDPDERAAFLDHACGGDTTLRRRVERLLDAHGGPASVTDTPSADSDLTADVHAPPDPGSVAAQSPPGPPPRSEWEGSFIGPYKLLQKLGEGGMGAVYMAEQEKPVRRRVALKLIKPGMDSRHVIARFEAERQALALMDHPHIAHVLDVGSTPSGRPFFVMDLVKGVPITEYCDRSHFTPRERLELFVQVCQAIQHAHQKGIIHRDIKPSNVLVSVSDDKPMPKVIDFGVAKAIDQRLSDSTLFTQFGQIVGTLEYMSPEQAEMGSLDIDTRSDVYSLGVVLYEMLTGTTPLVRSRLRDAPYTEVLRRIREEEPPRPSTRLSESEEALPSISAQRKTEPARLTKLLRFELDWIVMKALEKDRTRRYETASALARDIERYLHDEPVEAGPPSSGYKLRKLARKHRRALATAAAFAVLLLLAALTSSYLAFEAARSARAARTAELAAGKDRDRAVAAEATAQANLVKAQGEETRARQSQAETKAVLDFFQTRVLAAARPKDQAGGLGIDATIHQALDAAEPGIAQAFAGQPAVEASIRNTLGESYYFLGENAAALRQMQRALELLEEAHGPDHPSTLSALNNLALAYQAAGRRSEALPLHERGLSRAKAKLGADHLDTLNSMSNLALAYWQVGRLADALPLFEAALKGFEARLGRDHPDTLTLMNNLATVYRDAGKLDEAIPLFEDSLKRHRAKLGPDHAHTLMATNNLALAYQAAGRLPEAIPLYEATLKRQQATLGRDHPAALTTMHNLAGAYLDAGRRTDAIVLFEEALSRRRTKLGSSHPNTLQSMTGLARACLSTKPAQAETLLRECLAIREKEEPADWNTPYTRSLLGAALLAQQNYLQAEPLLLGGYHDMKALETKFQAQLKRRLPEAGARIVEFYEAWGKREKAEVWRDKLGLSRSSRG
jgi:serine/threonine protein kinase/tetratricopeptide (TPR) repeat protein